MLHVFGTVPTRNGPRCSRWGPAWSWATTWRPGGFPKWGVIDRDRSVTARQAPLCRDDVSGRVSEITSPILALHGTADGAAALDGALAAAVDHRGVVTSWRSTVEPCCEHDVPGRGERRAAWVPGDGRLILAGRSAEAKPADQPAERPDPGRLAWAGLLGGAGIRHGIRARSGRRDRVSVRGHRCRCRCRS